MCRHHWLIEEAAGPTSKGRCKSCGAERDFSNSPQMNPTTGFFNGTPRK
jgi:hypothetical protein